MWSENREMNIVTFRRKVLTSASNEHWVLPHGAQLYNFDKNPVSSGVGVEDG